MEKEERKISPLEKKLVAAERRTAEKLYNFRRLERKKQNKFFIGKCFRQDIATGSSEVHSIYCRVTSMNKDGDLNIIKIENWTNHFDAYSTHTYSPPAGIEIPRSHYEAALRAWRQGLRALLK